jgi:hypothetical protein
MYVVFHRKELLVQMRVTDEMVQRLQETFYAGATYQDNRLVRRALEVALKDVVDGETFAANLCVKIQQHMKHVPHDSIEVLRNGVFDEVISMLPPSVQPLTTAGKLILAAIRTGTHYSQRDFDAIVERLRPMVERT